MQKASQVNYDHCLLDNLTTGIHSTGLYYSGVGCGEAPLNTPHIIHFHQTQYRLVI